MAQAVRAKRATEGGCVVEARSLTPALRLSAHAWLLLVVPLTVLPHAVHLPAWIVALCIALIGWRAWQMHRSRARNPTSSRWLILAIALAAGVAVRLHFGHFFGKDPGIALLAVLLCLKQLELHRERDVRAAVLLGYFLQLSLFLHDQAPWIAALALAGTLVASVCLLSLQDRSATALEQLRTGAVIMSQALPFLVLLFIAFPRIPGPLWGLPADAFSARTGLSDTMQPGAIADLAQSGEIVMRAAFAGTAPPAGERYWRGPVLTHFDGRTWRAMAARPLMAPAYAVSGPAYSYQLTLEAHNRPWWLAMDFPGPGVDKVRYLSDFQLIAEAPLRTRSRIALSAHPQATIGLDEAPETLRAALQLPARFNPRTAEAVQALIASRPAPAERLTAVLAFFRDGGYTYTLQPPLLGRDSVDEFLFDTRRGFCEHFASAFVVMMREAGVPARVVTGYQGGERNPIDETLVIRQSDAHAWAEVWLEGRGWVRVDPTAAANPIRIDAGIAASLPTGEVLPIMMRPAFDWLRELRHRWDALSNSWNQWVLGYNDLRQRELLERLGFRDVGWPALATVLGAGMAVLLAALLAWAMLRRRNGDALDHAWAAFCAKLAAHGLPRNAWEGPIDYVERAARRWPHRAAVLRAVGARYAELRYGASTGDVRMATRQLLGDIKRIKNLEPK